MSKRTPEGAALNRERSRARSRERRAGETAAMAEARNSGDLQAIEAARALRDTGKGLTRRKRAEFVGVDGEGCRLDHEHQADPHGRQLYVLMRIGRRELWHGGARLTTAQCLDFILATPANQCPVGFAVNYDITMILRDLIDDDIETRAYLRDAEKALAEAEKTKDRARIERQRDNIATLVRRLYLPRLFAKPVETDDDKPKGQAWCHWRNYAIAWRPGKQFAVIQLDKDGKTIGGSCRRIYETFGFFQESFIKALQSYNVGSDAEHATIEAGKQRRGTSDRLHADDRTYCAREVELLAELMEKFRALVEKGGLGVGEWSGAGQLASYMHRQHATPILRQQARLNTMQSLVVDVPPGALDMAARAFYGGRFEVTRIGDIPGPIYEYDINSAYPAAMLQLPCLHHAEWNEGEGEELRDSQFFVAEASYSHRKDAALCGLPHRYKDGGIAWPRQGQGIYWSPELNAAELLGATITPGKGWRCVQHCGCRPFDWIGEQYQYRKMIESAGGKAAGKPIKLGINALYGQFARRVGGGGAYHNPIYAGLITSLTRAALARAAAQKPHAVLMLATDGIYTTEPLILSLGPGLGQWECKTLETIHIVQPGLYWGRTADDATTLPGKRRTRGISGNAFAPAIPAFSRAWTAALANWDNEIGQQPRTRHTGTVLALDAPKVPVPLTLFTGAKLADAQGRPERAGTWNDDRRLVSYAWRRKRDEYGQLSENRQSVLTRPLAGSPHDVSMAYETILALHQGGDTMPTELQGQYSEWQPDWLTFKTDEPGEN